MSDIKEYIKKQTFLISSSDNKYITILLFLMIPFAFVVRWFRERKADKAKGTSQDQTTEGNSQPQ